jgi:hypothetical protein
MRSTPFGINFDIAPPLTHAERLARLDALATLLDTAFLIPGTNVRFGLDALIGLVPVVGDAITTLISLYIVREARALAVDGVVGAVPMLGDMFDVVWRANRRNVALLQKHFANEPRWMA